MPRRKTTPDEVIAQPLMLPAAVPLRAGANGRRREREIDPYEAAIGAVPTKVSRKGQSKPIDRKLTPDEERTRAELALVQKVRVERYHAYLDALAANGGNRIAALVQVFRLPADDAVAHEGELLEEVAAGRSDSPMTNLLERADLDMAARIALLRQHAYSDNPGASLKALDIIEGLVGQGGELGSFESYLRLVKAQA